MARTPRSLPHQPLTLQPILLGPLPPFPAPASCFIDCLAGLPPALPSPAGSSPTPPPGPHSLPSCLCPRLSLPARRRHT